MRCKARTPEKSRSRDALAIPKSPDQVPSSTSPLGPGLEDGSLTSSPQNLAQKILKSVRPHHENGIVRTSKSSYPPASADIGGDHLCVIDHDSNMKRRTISGDWHRRRGASCETCHMPSNCVMQEPSTILPSLAPGT